MTKRVLVTGGARFLDSHLCERLLSDRHEVNCLDNFGGGQRKNIEEFEDHASSTVIDRYVRMLESFLSVDRIYHLASRASPADFTCFPVNIALTNTQGTRRLLDHARACARGWCSPARVKSTATPKYTFDYPAESPLPYVRRVPWVTTSAEDTESHEPDQNTYNKPEENNQRDVMEE